MKQVNKSGAHLLPHGFQDCPFIAWTIHEYHRDNLCSASQAINTGKTLESTIHTTARDNYKRPTQQNHYNVKNEKHINVKNEKKENEQDQTVDYKYLQCVFQIP